jgi:hypothetical protein
MMQIRGRTMLSHAGSSLSAFLVTLLAFAGCGSSGRSSAKPDTAAADGDAAMIAETGLTPLTPPTLETGVDLAAFAAVVTSQVIEYSIATDTVQVGRPWGQFDVHKGPRLVFRGSWRVLVASDGDYVTIATVARDGDSYKLVGYGSTQFIPAMVELEQMPAVSAALERGRAGFLRRSDDGGDSVAAYEAGVDAGQAEIRVRPLGVLVTDAGVVAEMSLDEFDSMVPAE